MGIQVTDRYTCSTTVARNYDCDVLTILGLTDYNQNQSSIGDHEF